MQIVLVGGGRLGATLASALLPTAHAVTLVVRDAARRARLARDPRWDGVHLVAALDDAPSANVDVWTVPDRALTGVTLRPPARAPIACHAAGSLPLTVLPPRAGVARGVLHPLAACPDPLTVPNATPLVGATFGIAGEAQALDAMAALARDLGGRPMPLPSGTETAYHAAAALAANDLVALLLAAERTGRAAGLDPSAFRQGLVHLARTALDALARVPDTHDWVDGLTGAVARGDDATLRAHLCTLDANARALHAAASRALTDAARDAGRLSTAAAERLRSALDDAQ